MMGKSMSRILGTATVIVGLLALGACSEAAPDVDRVQTNLVDKGVFEGDWWYATTIVGTRYDAADVLGSAGGFGPFSGSMSNIDLGLDTFYTPTMARVRWVIDENYLFAYRAYELIRGGNDGGFEPEFRGQPLAAFRIQNHVDVRQEYNPVTGEVTNVRVENASDRRWYERQFMRVDWSQNLISSFYLNDVDYGELFNVLRPEPVPFFFQEGAHGGEFPESWRPQFVRVKDDPGFRWANEWPAAMQDAVHYMSFVTQEVWSPGSNCFVYGSACSSAAVTVRSSFLRVPPNHEYASETIPHQEFDRFGIFRSYQRTYVRGGQDEGTLHHFCNDDADCGAGGACDTGRHICVGGLSGDYGELDFLSFHRSRHNIWSDSLTDKQCLADWECDGRYEEVPGTAGSQCDRTARRCTIPVADRPVRRVTYHLNAGYPAHLVRAAFEVIGGWNEVFMKGQRAVKGREAPSGSVTQTCQNTDPTSYCFCGSAEDTGGSCAYRYDPFETPADAMARGVVEPYDCYIKGPADVASPTAYGDYRAPEAYQYEFVGDECLLELKSNSCDLDSTKACEELGDIRYQFFNYVQHGAVGFGGVALLQAEPTTGELVTANINVNGESVESVGSRALLYFRVLRGEIDEAEYFAGEELRGYYARLGSTNHPVALAASGTDGYSITDPSRPGIPADIHAVALERLEAAAPRVERLRGPDGRAQIFSDRLRSLAGTDVEQRLMASLGPDGRDAMMQLYPRTQMEPGMNPTDDRVLDKTSPFRGGFLGGLLAEQKRQDILARRNYCTINEGELYNSAWWGYWAEVFRDRPLEEAAIRMQQVYLRAVMFHEAGHAMGLRHNFGASFDRNNYFDGYYKIARELPLPRFQAFDGPALGGNGDGTVTGEEANRYVAELRRVRDERAARGAGNVMGSSTMDYHGDLSDFSGLGHYDHAAVIWSYFNQAQVFTGDPRIDQPNSTLNGLHESDVTPRTFVTYYRGGESCEVDTHCPYSAGRAPVAGQEITQRCVRNPRYSRLPTPCGAGDRDCVCSTFDEDMRDYVEGAAYNNDVNDDGEIDLFPTRFLFCTDERVNDISWCTRFDAGESFRDSIENYRRTWEQGYPNAYYRRYRRGGAAGGASVQGIIDSAKIYQHLFFRYFNEPGFRSDAGPLGVDDQYYASVDAMNWFAELTALPEVGSYKLDTDANVYRRISDAPGAPGADFSLGVGQGYPMWSAYQSGLEGFFRTERAGTFYDKYIAMYALALRDWGFSYTVDERYYINFYDLFAVEMTEFFGGHLLDNPRWYAPRVSVTGGEATITHMDWFRDFCTIDGISQPCRGSQDVTYTQPALDGTSAEILRDWASMLALAEFPVFYDTSFEQRISIYKLGNGDGYRIPERLPDGRATCEFGAAGCTEPDYIRYQSDRLHTTYVALVIRPRLDYNLPEEQLGFQLLRELRDVQTRVRELEAIETPTAAEEAELRTKRAKLEKGESFLDFLIELQRQFGISSYFF